MVFKSSLGSFLSQFLIHSERSLVEKKWNWPITYRLRNNAHFKIELLIRILQKLPSEEKEMDSSTLSEKNITFEFDVETQESFTTFGKEESSENLVWFGKQTKKLHEKR